MLTGGHFIPFLSTQKKKEGESGLSECPGFVVGLLIDRETKRHYMTVSPAGLPTKLVLAALQRAKREEIPV